jgi:hypothetical protein
MLDETDGVDANHPPTGELLGNDVLGPPVVGVAKDRDQDDTAGLKTGIDKWSPMAAGTRLSRSNGNRFPQPLNSQSVLATSPSELTTKMGPLSRVQTSLVGMT